MAKCIAKRAAFDPPKALYALRSGHFVGKDDFTLVIAARTVLSRGCEVYVGIRMAWRMRQTAKTRVLTSKALTYIRSYRSWN